MVRLPIGDGGRIWLNPAHVLWLNEATADTCDVTLAGTTLRTVTIAAPAEEVAWLLSRSGRGPVVSGSYVAPGGFLHE